nr:PEP-CTERM sorting domain-containing protein [Deltaproteobacteria bacterium]
MTVMATATKKKHGPSPTTVGLFAAGAAAVWWIGAKRRRKTSTGTSLT